MNKREMREIAIGAVRSELRRQGRHLKDVDADAALNMLDDVARAEPKLIAARWYLEATDSQWKCFRSEWQKGRETSCVAPVLWVKSNDSSTSYHTNEQIAHLLIDGKGTTLCGANHRLWLTKAVAYLGGALLCAKCEHAAKIRSLEIPQ